MKHITAFLILASFLGGSPLRGEGYVPTLMPGAPWPTIHQSPAGIKDGGVGTVAGVIRDTFSGAAPILMTLGPKYLYVQSAGSTRITLFDPMGLDRGELRSADLGASYPTAGGGALDQYHRTWWTDGKRLVRLAPDLSSRVVSEDLSLSIPENERASLKLNSVDFLSDGTVLVGSLNGPRVFLVDPRPGPNGIFPRRATLSRRDFTASGIPIVGDNESYGPRPIQDRDGFLYMNTSSRLLKIAYAGGSLQREVMWAFRNPQNQFLGNQVSSPVVRENSDLAISNPVVIQNFVCVCTGPKSAGVKMRIYCLDRYTGALVHDFEPFTQAGVKALHTLGGIDGEAKLFAIGNSSNATTIGDGGVAGFQLGSGTRLWSNVRLNNVSESFVVASGVQRLYLMKKNNPAANFELVAVDTRTGAASLLDSFSAPLNPLPSLGATGPGGVYYPNPQGLKRYADFPLIASWVGKAYGRLLGRPADPGGEAGWSQAIAGGMKYREFVSNVAASEEYFIRQGRSPQNFVHALYRDLLGRPADPAGFAGWLAVLSAGGSRKSVTDGFVNSFEFTGVLGD